MVETRFKGGTRLFELPRIYPPGFVVTVPVTSCQRQHDKILRLGTKKNRSGAYRMYVLPRALLGGDRRPTTLSRENRRNYDGTVQNVCIVHSMPSSQVLQHTERIILPTQDSL